MKFSILVVCLAVLSCATAEVLETKGWRADVDVYGGALKEIYSVRPSGNSETWTQVLSHQGPTIAPAWEAAMGIAWTSVEKASDIQLIVRGQYQAEFDTDHAGSDYQKIDLGESGDWTQCKTYCQQDSKCQLWTFVVAHKQAEHALCYLKDTIPVASYTDGCVSGRPHESINITKTITAAGDSHGPVVSIRASSDVDRTIAAWLDWYTFLPDGPMDFIFSQSIKHASTDMIPHWQYKAPAVILQSGAVMAAVVPALDLLTPERLKAFPSMMDLENPTSQTQPPRMGIGAAPGTKTMHSIYGYDTTTTMAWGPSTAQFEQDYLLYLNGAATPGYGYQELARLMWAVFYSPRLADSPHGQRNWNQTNLDLFAAWEQDTWHRYAPDVFDSFKCGNRTCGGLGDCAKGNSQFNAWFQSLRTAYGWYLYSQKTSNHTLADAAKAVLHLQLAAPLVGRSGFTPSEWQRDTPSSYHWVDACWANLCRVLPEPPLHCDQYYHAFDMAWTNYWLLRWAELVPEYKDEIVSRTVQFADFMLSHQESNGGFPAFFLQDAEGNWSSSGYFKTNSETAGVAYFLGELSGVVKSTHPDKAAAYLSSAKNAMAYMEAEIIPRSKWFDFETFLSCSQKPLDFFDPYTNQEPQNNLGKLQAALAYFKLYELTSEASYLGMAVAMTDLNSLTQAHWSHPLLPKANSLLGGFTTQNTDAEWSDARQCYAAEMYMRAYEHTHELQYLERYVGALRASFAVFKSENWAHEGGGPGTKGDAPGGWTGIHWSSGSALTVNEMFAETTGDAYINAKYKHGVGINGCTLTLETIGSTELSCKIVSPFTWSAPLRLIVADAQADMDVSVNGVALGHFTPGQLAAGIAVKL